MKTVIGIPSYHRSDVFMDKRHTYGQIPDTLRKHTFIFVRPAEEQAYIDEIDMPCGIAELTNIEKRIENGASSYVATTRDMIIEWAIENAVDVLIMMDDDLRFTYKDANRRLVPISDYEFESMIARLATHIDMNTPLSSIDNRMFANTHANLFDVNRLSVQVFGIYIPFYRTHPEIRFQKGWNSVYSSDKYFVLSTIEAGARQITFNRWQKSEQYNAEGGCNDPNRLELEHRSVLALAARFPQYIEPVYRNGRWRNSVKWNNVPYRGRNHP